MRKFNSLIIVAFFSITIQAQQGKAHFLHHSTGKNLFNDGGVAKIVNDYNTANETNFKLSETWYPGRADNYPFDYWDLWINGACDDNNNGLKCLGTLTESYELIIFKHCYPGSEINIDKGSPDVGSSVKSIENYKLQYRALRELLDSYTNTKFLMWTLVPLHRMATDAEQAQRANQFVQWVKNDWLTEDGKEHNNIFLFDFFGYAAEHSASPVNGFQYSLKYDYEGGHESSDSHPNTLANETIGPHFAQAIIDVLNNKLPVDPKPTNGLEELKGTGLWLSPNPSNGNFNILLPEDFENEFVTLEIFSLNGAILNQYSDIKNNQSINFKTSPGIYLVKMRTSKDLITSKLIIE